MSHLSEDELRRWRDSPSEADRARVVDHLAACDSCGGVLAELVRSRPLEAAAEVTAPQTARGRGYAARRPAAFAPRPLLLAAGIAALSAALGFLLVGGPAQDAGTLRGVELRPIEPAGEVAWPFTFRWTSPVAAASYRVDVYDAAGDLVHSERTSAESLEMPGLADRVAGGGRHAWEVTALGADGEPILTSERRTFVVARAP